MNFPEFLLECGKNTEFVENYDRLRGTNLSMSGTPMDLEIDKTTGRLDEEVRDFAEFVLEIFARAGAAEQEGRLI